MKQENIPSKQKRLSENYQPVQDEIESRLGDLR